MNYSSQKILDGFSTCFRQWRATHSHCQYLHGYALSFEVDFTGRLDMCSWIQDFGSFKRNGIKETLSYYFDHTLVAAHDDPHLKQLQALHEEGLIQLRILPHVGCERFASFVFSLINQIVDEESKGRVSVKSVRCFENGKNSASYSGHNCHTFELTSSNDIYLLTSNKL